MTPLPGRSLLHDVPFVAFDTETTGLGPHDRLVELAGVRFREGRVEAEWSALVDPGIPIPQQATAIHGIRDADVRDRPRAQAVLPDFLRFIDGAALVGHNAPFDVRMVALALLQAGLPLPDNPVLDTCAIPRRLQVDVPDHRLGTLADAFGVRHGRGHRALDDARVAGALLQAYLDHLGPGADALVRRALTQDGLRLSLRSFAGEPVPETSLVALVRRARAEGSGLDIDDGIGVVRIRPRDLYAIGGRLYLEADCAGSGRRTFAADAIVSARLWRPVAPPL